MVPLTTWVERSPAATVRASRMLLQAAEHRVPWPATSEVISSGARLYARCWTVLLCLQNKAAEPFRACQKPAVHYSNKVFHERQCSKTLLLKSDCLL